MKEFVRTVSLINRTLRHKSETEILDALNNLVKQEHWKRGSVTKLSAIFSCIHNLITKVLGYKAYETQLLAGYYLQQSMIVELKTGEGKTLASVFPVISKVLGGNICHVATVNDYLARRDQDWGSPIFDRLNVSTGLIQSGSSLAHRAQAYSKSVTYINSSEVGFDQMRDTLSVNNLDQLQSKLDYILIDEIDSILIDSARTPLLLSGQNPNNHQLAFIADELARCLRLDEDFEADSKQKNVFLTSSGLSILEQLLGITDLYDSQGGVWVSRVLNSLRARLFFNENLDYMVGNREIILLDQVTGRALPGRRWSEGLHQAVEAKEGLSVQGEPDIIASTTYQNTFSAYQSVGGMSGTVAQAVDEFNQVYGLQVILLPTNRSSITTQLPARIYRNELNKCRGIITECCVAQLEHESPVLIATLDIERSELISELLAYNNISHKLLNARPELASVEAETVSQAGRRNIVTVSTNMAGRGTDILLGGNSQACLASLERSLSDQPRSLASLFNLRPTYSDCLNSGLAFIALKSLCLRKIWRLYRQPLVGRHSLFSFSIPLLSLNCSEKEFVRCSGGLYVLSSEKSESGRVDQQLVGRTGRQGDPGKFRFVLSLEDKILRQVGLTGLVQRYATIEPIYDSALYNLFSQAQTRVESLFSNVRQQTFRDQTILNYYKSQMLTDRQFVVWEKLVAKWIIMIFSRTYHQNDSCLSRLILKEVPTLEHIWLFYDSRRALTYLWYSTKLSEYLEKILILNLLDASWRQFQEVFLALKKGLVWKTWGRRDLLTGYIEASQHYLAYQAKHYQETVVLSLD